MEQTEHLSMEKMLERSTVRVTEDGTEQFVPSSFVVCLTEKVRSAQCIHQTEINKSGAMPIILFQGLQ